MKVAIISCVWGRLSLTRIWWQSITRIEAVLRAADIDVQTFVAGSESAQSALCGEYGGKWIEASNDRLGLKWDTVAKAALASGADYVLILGSDDFMSPQLIERYIDLMRQGTVFAGMQALYMAEPQSRRVMLLDTQKRIREITYEEAAGRCTVIDLDAHPPGNGELYERGLRYISHSLTLGAGRLVHRSLFEGVDDYWEADKRRALDADFETRLNLPLATIVPCTPSEYIVDVKTGVNIWSFDSLDASFPDCLLSELEIQQMSPIPEWPQLLELA